MMSAYATEPVNKDTGQKVQKNTYIGQKACAKCHVQQSMLWKGSHHDQAMQAATIDTVLGDFNNALVIFHDTTFTFYYVDNQFFVKKTTADGKEKDFAIRYTFGVFPLQQYLIEMPGGRLQVLDLAWDNRPVQLGGQRWYVLPFVKPLKGGQILASRNWNANCAACHSTNIQKNYNALKNDYATKWSEMDVSCEACHGPGYEHQQWAISQANQQAASQSSYRGFNNSFISANKTQWHIDPITGKPLRSSKGNNRAEIETCARCHSRRKQLRQGIPGEPYMDNFQPHFLDDGLYYADGQMQDEVYVYGSFLQSSKYQSGVTCSDCHEPHVAELRLPGDRICNQCHLAEKFRTHKHHHHSASSDVTCLNCHMPTKVVMGIDARHDHSFQIPNPQNTIDFNTPNACNQCHEDKSAQWAIESMSSWGVKKIKAESFAHIMDAQRKQLSRANQKAINLLKQSSQPVIAQATILSQLSESLDQDALKLIEQQLQHEDAMIRVAALIALDNGYQSGSITFEQIAQLAMPLISDPVRLVRMEAARLLAALDESLLEEKDAKDLKVARQEYIDSLNFNVDLPESLINMADFYLAMNDPELAEKTYRQALQLHPGTVQVWTKMAQFYSELDRENDAIQLLQQGIEKIEKANSAALYHDMGLAQVRLNKLDKSLESLATAAQLEPDNPHYSYVYGIALNSNQRSEEAINVLMQSSQKHPQERPLLMALSSISQDNGNYQEALDYAEKLLLLDPDDLSTQERIKQLKTLIP